jgi:hypothetical protein
MLLMGAVVVRLANKFLDSFKESKKFVLIAIYIWSDAKVSRFSLFQEPDNTKVCWTLYIIKLTGRVFLGYLQRNQLFVELLG